jgi:hypothetical protein
MGDEAARRAERREQAEGVEMLTARAIRERMRGADLTPDRVEWAARLGHSGARELFPEASMPLTWDESELLIGQRAVWNLLDCEELRRYNVEAGAFALGGLEDEGLEAGLRDQVADLGQDLERVRLHLAGNARDELDLDPCPDSFLEEAWACDLTLRDHILIWLAVSDGRDACRPKSTFAEGGFKLAAKELVPWLQRHILTNSGYLPPELVACRGALLAGFLLLGSPPPGWPEHYRQRSRLRPLDPALRAYVSSRARVQEKEVKRVRISFGLPVSDHVVVCEGPGRLEALRLIAEDLATSGELAPLLPEGLQSFRWDPRYENPGERYHRLLFSAAEDSVGDVERRLDAISARPTVHCGQYSSSQEEPTPPCALVFVTDARASLDEQLASWEACQRRIVPGAVTPLVRLSFGPAPDLVAVEGIHQLGPALDLSLEAERCRLGRVLKFLFGTCVKNCALWHMGRAEQAET